MEIPRQLTILGCHCRLSRPRSSGLSNRPRPHRPRNPAPWRPLASSRSLNAAPELDAIAVIVITDDNLDELGRGAVLTRSTARPSPTPVPSKPSTGRIRRPARNGGRRSWLRAASSPGSKHGALTPKAELDRLERGKLDGRTLDRIAKAEGKLQAIDAEIRSEKAQLSTIIREARKEGAQPGWFR